MELIYIQSFGKSPHNKMLKKEVYTKYVHFSCLSNYIRMNLVICAEQPLYIGSQPNAFSTGMNAETLVLTCSSASISGIKQSGSTLTLLGRHTHPKP